MSSNNKIQELAIEIYRDMQAKYPEEDILPRVLLFCGMMLLFLEKKELAEEYWEFLAECQADLL